MKLVKITIATIAFAISIFSCKKNSAVYEMEVPKSIKQEIVSKSATEQVKYAEENLKDIASELSKSFKKPGVMAFIRQEASNSKTGDAEVLIEKLLKNEDFKSKVNTPKLETAIANFKELGEDKNINMYPQIYIPSLNEGSNYRLIGDEENPLLVWYGGADPSNPIINAEAFYNDSNETLTSFGLINENFGNNNNVIVFSLSDLIPSNLMVAMPNDAVTNEFGEYFSGGGSSGSGSGVGNGGGVGNTDPDIDVEELGRPWNPTMFQNTPVNSKIESMRITNYNEEWLAGGSEICIRAALNCWNNRKDGLQTEINFQYRTDQRSNYLGKFIKKYKRRWITNGDTKTLNYPLQVGWPSAGLISNPVYFDYLIFERDVWPVGLNHTMRSGHQLPPPLNTYISTEAFKQYNRSADNPYVVATITTDPTRVLGIGCIFYDNGYFDNGPTSLTTKAF